LESGKRGSNNTGRSRKNRLGQTDVRPGLLINPWIYYADKQRLVIPKTLLESSLSAGAILAFGLLRMHGGKNHCIVGQARLADELGVSVRTARRYVRELVANHFIRTTIRGKQEGGRTTDEYHPVWNEFWRKKAPNPLNMEIGRTFEWRRFVTLKWPSYFIPLDLISAVSACAALCWGALSAELRNSESECQVSRAKLSRRLHWSRRKVLAYTTELRTKGRVWIRARNGSNNERIANLHRFVLPKKNEQPGKPTAETNEEENRASVRS